MLLQNVSSMMVQERGLLPKKWTFCLQTSNLV
jgi:hypothetical protein